MFGKRLRHLRKREGLSQIELANRLGIPNQNVSNYERGFRHPDFDTLKMIARYFGVTTDYLLGHKVDDINLMTDDEIDEEIKEITNEINVWFKSEPKDKREKLAMLRKVVRAFTGEN